MVAKFGTVGGRPRQHRTTGSRFPMIVAVALLMLISIALFANSSLLSKKNKRATIDAQQVSLPVDKTTGAGTTKNGKELVRGTTAPVTKAVSHESDSSEEGDNGRGDAKRSYPVVPKQLQHRGSLKELVNPAALGELSSSTPWCANNKKGSSGGSVKGIDFPHNRKAPAAVQGISDRHQSLQYNLYGASKVEHGKAADFGSLSSGWYCVEAVDSKKECAVSDTAFVVTEGSRKGTEYAVPASHVVDLLTVKAKHLEKDKPVLDLAQHDEGVASKKPEGALRVKCPLAVPERMAVLCAVTMDEARHEEKGSISNENKVDDMFSRAVDSTRRLLLTSKERTADVDLFADRGTFWLQFGEHHEEEQRKKKKKSKDKTLAPPFYYQQGAHRVLKVHDDGGSSSTYELEWSSDNGIETPKKGDPSTITISKPTFVKESSMHSVRSEKDLLQLHAKLIGSFKADKNVATYSEAMSKYSLCRVHFEESMTLTKSFVFGGGGMNAGLLEEETSWLRKKLDAISTGGKSNIQSLGCVLTFAPGVIIRVAESAKIQVRGGTTEDVDPILLTSPDPAKLWGGFIVEAHGTLTIHNAFITYSGGSLERLKGTGTHHKLAPAVTAGEEAALHVTDSVIANCHGPGFGLGKHADATIESTLLQDVAQGGECVSCHVLLKNSHVLDIPYRPVKTDAEIQSAHAAFIDEDNDGFYFRGGKATVDGVIIANTLDDGIDSASSKGDHEHSTLDVTSTLIMNVQHEGIALSGSKGVRRSVSVSKSALAFCQQGIENGYSPSTHDATLNEVLLLSNDIGLRHGDNYGLDVDGHVVVSSSAFAFNAQAHVLNFVKKHQGHVHTSTEPQPPTASLPVTVHSSGFRSFFSSSAFKKDTALSPGEEHLVDTASIVDVRSGALCGVQHFSTASSSSTKATAAAKDNLDVDAALHLFKDSVNGKSSASHEARRVMSSYLSRSQHDGEGHNRESSDRVAAGVDPETAVRSGFFTSLWAGSDVPHGIPRQWQWVFAVQTNRHS